MTRKMKRIVNSKNNCNILSKDKSIEEIFLREIYQDYNENIRHLETFISGHFEYFITISLAFSTFISSALLWSFDYCEKNNYVCDKEWIKIGEIFYLPSEAIALIIYAGLVVTIVCYAILLIITKANMTKNVNSNKKQNIENLFFSSEAIRKLIDKNYQTSLETDNCISKNILLAGRIQKISPLIYISSLLAFEIYLFILQNNFQICTTVTITCEVLVMFVELLGILLYIWLHSCVWETYMHIWIRDQKNIVLKKVSDIRTSLQELGSAKNLEKIL